MVPLGLLSLCCLLPAGAPAVSARQPARLAVYVGTYTDGASKGIYRFTIDGESGRATDPVLVAETRNPSFLALHPTGRFLYAVNEVGGSVDSPHGEVTAFSIDPRTGALTRLNAQSSRGAAPCHLVVDRRGRNVLVANYGGGTVAVLPIAEDGRLGPASSVRQHTGSGPNARRQQAPHAHGIHLDPAERFAFSPDLGADRVFVHRYDAAAGSLEPHGAGTVEPGSGPRHATLSADGRVLYAINELTSTITVFDVDAAKGTLAAVQAVSTLPAGFTGESWTAEIAISPDGRHVYGSNRGHDSVAVFAVEQGSGRLTARGHVPAGGKTPRHFAIDPTGRWMLVAHQGDDAIAVFRLDARTGLPSPTGVKVRVGRPVCLMFAPATTR
jgi:6-phosphogluconolactonase